jgi:hypothetical protein
VGEVGGEVAELKLAACEAISAHHIVQGAELRTLEEPVSTRNLIVYLKKLALNAGKDSDTFSFLLGK